MRLARVKHGNEVVWVAQDNNGVARKLGTGSQVDVYDRTISIISLPDAEIVDLNNVEFLPPIPEPGKVVCIGKNYADHAREMGGEPPEIPVVFSKFSSCVIGHQQKIVLPAISVQVDYEAELVVVIGKSGKNISQDSAFEHVLGYTCGNDVSARDWQKGRPGGQWLLGKAFDTFAPIGPWLVASDQISNPHDLDIRLRLNDVEMQASNTSHLIHQIDFLISHLSKFFCLMPGDLIFTGTPAGVGAGRTPPVWLKDGDVVEVEISGIGVLRNVVSSEE